MADKKVILEVEIIEGNAQSTLNELKASLKSLDKTHKDYKPTLQLIAKAERDLAKAQQNRILVEKGLANSTVKVEKETKKTAKQMKQLSSDTGASTSASLELGRVFSDMPYGIRGVANNIQQLASNLFFMSKKTDEATGKSVGFGGALKKLGTGLWGATGVLVAFQAGIALLDYFKVGMGEAEESSSDLKSSLEDLTDTIDDLSISQENINDKIEDYITLQDLEKELNKSKTESNKRLLEIEEDLVSLREDNAKKQKKLLLEMTVAEYEALSDEEKAAHRRATLSVDFSKRFNQLKKNIEEEGSLEKEKRGIIEGSIDIETKYKKSKKLFNAAEKDSLKGLKNSKKEKEEERELLSKTSQEYKKLTKTIDEYQKKIEEIQGVKPKNRPKVDVLGLDSIDIGENKKKMKKVLDAVADAVGVDLKKDPLKIDTNLDLELSDEAKKMVSDKLKSDLDNLMLDSKLEDAKEFIDKSKAVLGAMTDFVNSEFERELTIEQNKTNALNTELNNRLNNENLSKDQRASIQNQIAQNDEKLRVKQDAIEKKRFKMNKAANIANALMDTASAAIGVMAQARGGFLQRLSEAIPTIAFGLAQVATIARQKFQSSASNTPINTAGGGGGGGGSRAEPSFNIVGRSQDNILLGAIQSQFDKPLKAYVVARDVTNQQQLDGVISTSAST